MFKAVGFMIVSRCLLARRHGPKSVEVTGALHRPEHTKKKNRYGRIYEYDSSIASEFRDYVSLQKRIAAAGLTFLTLTRHLSFGSQGSESE